MTMDQALEMVEALLHQERNRVQRSYHYDEIIEALDLIGKLREANKQKQAVVQSEPYMPTSVL